MTGTQCEWCDGIEIEDNLVNGRFCPKCADGYYKEEKKMKTEYLSVEITAYVVKNPLVELQCSVRATLRRPAEMGTGEEVWRASMSFISAPNKVRKELFRQLAALGLFNPDYVDDVEAGHMTLSTACIATVREQHDDVLDVLQDVLGPIEHVVVKPGTRLLPDVAIWEAI